MVSDIGSIQNAALVNPTASVGAGPKQPQFGASSSAIEDSYTPSQPRQKTSATPWIIAGGGVGALLLLLTHKGGEGEGMLAKLSKAFKKEKPQTTPTQGPHTNPNEPNLGELEDDFNMQGGQLLQDPVSLQPNVGRRNVRATRRTSDLTLWSDQVLTNQYRLRQQAIHDLETAHGSQLENAADNLWRTQRRHDIPEMQDYRLSRAQGDLNSVINRLNFHHERLEEIRGEFIRRGIAEPEPLPNGTPPAAPEARRNWRFWGG